MIKVDVITAFEKLKPESCVFVLSTGENNKPSGMIASWSMKCSYSPPLFAIAIDNTRYTKQLIDFSQEFVIAVPNKQMEEVVRFFGNTSGRETDKFKTSKIKTLPSSIIKTPILRDATINLECKVHSGCPAGDHYLYLGEVKQAHINTSKEILFSLPKKDGKRFFSEFKI